MHSPFSLSWLRLPRFLFWLSCFIIGSFWRCKSRVPDFTEKFVTPFTIITFYRGLKIRIIRPRNRTALTRITIRHVYFAWCTHVWRIRSHDQSVYGGWLTKLQLGQFSRRKKAQRGIRSTLYLFQCVNVFNRYSKKWPCSRQLTCNLFLYTWL